MILGPKAMRFVWAGSTPSMEIGELEVSMAPTKTCICPVNKELH